MHTLPYDIVPVVKNKYIVVTYVARLYVNFITWLINLKLKNYYSYDEIILIHKVEALLDLLPRKYRYILALYILKSVRKKDYTILLLLRKTDPERVSRLIQKHILITIKSNTIEGSDILNQLMNTCQETNTMLEYDTVQKIKELTGTKKFTRAVGDALNAFPMEEKTRNMLKTLIYKYL